MDRHTYIHTDIQTDRDTDIHTYIHTDRQRYRHTYRHTNFNWKKMFLFLTYRTSVQEERQWQQAVAEAAGSRRHNGNRPVAEAAGSRRHNGSRSWQKQQAVDTVTDIHK